MKGKLDFRELLEGLGEPYLFVDGSGMVVYGNPPARETFASMGQVEGKSLEEVVANKGLAEALARVLEEGRAIRGFPLNLGAGDHERHLLASIYPMDTGKNRGAGILFRDVTRLRMLEEREEKALTISLVEEVLSRAFHQLKGPLTGLRGAVQLLEEGNGDPAEYARFIRREVLRLQQLVEDALDFSRPLVLERVETNVHRVLEEVLSTFKHQAMVQGVKVERLYDPSLPSIMADPFRLYQVFANLVKNALEAMPQGGVLRVKTGLAWNKRLLPGVDTLSVRVEDEGPGLSPQVEEQLFSPFNTSKAKGTGLGLSTAYKIIKYHQGHLWYKREGSWTVFEVLLPMAR